MKRLATSEITPTIAQLVLGAGSSIDVMGFTGFPLFHYRDGVEFDDLTALADTRLRLRAVLKRSERVISSRRELLETTGRVEESRKGAWRIRIPPFLPPAHVLIVDGEVAIFMDIAGAMEEPESVYLAENPSELEEMSRLFESAWSGTPSLIYLDNLQLLDSSAVRTVVALCEEHWQDLITDLARNPDRLHNLDSRRFEELVAELLSRDGMNVELTPRSKDGGRDVLAYCTTPVGEHLFYVECKRYSPDNPVDIRIVRELFGVVEAERATAGMIVTTSRFTSGALQFRESVRHRMTLKDYERLWKWLGDHARR